MKIPPSVLSKVSRTPTPYFHDFGLTDGVGRDPEGRVSLYETSVNLFLFPVKLFLFPKKIKMVEKIEKLKKSFHQLVMNTHSLPETSTNPLEYFKLKIKSIHTKQQQMKIKYCKKLETQKDEYEVSTSPDDFLKILQTQISQIQPLFEYFDPHDIVKPYFDIDLKYSPSIKETNKGYGYSLFNNLQKWIERRDFLFKEENILEIIQDVFPEHTITIDNLKIFKSFNSLEPMDWNKDPEEDHKCGLHIYLLGFKTTPYILGKYVKKYNKGRDIIDQSIYHMNLQPDGKGKQMLRCPMVLQLPSKPRLYKDTRHCNGLGNKTDWIIQYIEDDYIMIEQIEEPQEEKTKNTKKFTPPNKPEKSKYRVLTNIPIDIIEPILEQTNPPTYNKKVLCDCIWSLMCNEVPTEWITRWLNSNSSQSIKSSPFTIEDLTINFEECDSPKYSIGTFLNIVLKEHNKTMFLEIMDEYGYPEYQEFKKYLEETTCKVLDRCCYYSIDTQGKPEFLKRNQLTEKWEHLTMTIDDREIPMINKWFKDRNIRIVNDVVFYPPPILDQNILNNPDKYINKYIPPVYPPKPEGQLKHSYTELLFNMCNEDQEIFSFMMKWCYNLIYLPSIQPLVGVCFKADQGTGKNVFFQKFIGNLIGGRKYYSISSNIDEIFCRFSIFRHEKLLCIFEESHTSKKVQEQIKSSITNNEGIYEVKGIQSKEITYNDRFVFLSNKDYPVNVERSDRRMCIIETTKCEYSKEWKDNGKWTYLHNECDNPEEIYGFLEDLENYKIDRFFDFKSNRPNTEIYRRVQIVQNKHPVETFIEKFLIIDRTGVYCDGFRTISMVDGDFTKGFDTFSLFNQFKQSNGGSQITSHQHFNGKVKEYFPGLIEHKRVIVMGNKITMCLFNDEMIKHYIEKCDEQQNLFL